MKYDKVELSRREKKPRDRLMSVIYQTIKSLNSSAPKQTHDRRAQNDGLSSGNRDGQQSLRETMPRPDEARTLLGVLYKMEAD